MAGLNSCAGMNRLNKLSPHREESGVKGREEAVYSDCWAELWANRPHPLCDQPTLIARMAVPLTNHDQAGQQTGINNMRTHYFVTETSTF